MDKNTSNKILNLKMPKENKKLILKISKKINFLSAKIDDFFDQDMNINPKTINQAFVVDKDFITILYKYDDTIKKIENYCNEIINKNNINEIYNFQIDSSDELNELKIIEKSIIDNEKVISSYQKQMALNKKINYLKLKTKIRKKQMKNSFNEMEKKILDSKFVDIEENKEDMKLIENFIDKKYISKSKYLYLISFSLITISIYIFGVLIWVLINVN
ncbi:MAG: hypothetical protein TYPL_1240 [Candidatus Tyloplasma litorale]|nr:MAG: hypothetical protein TYPL_1240 [Mycoplasmatales bacterium]